MKEHGLIYTGDMIRAILDGRKTVTRRLVMPQPTYHLFAFDVPQFEYKNKLYGAKTEFVESCCPYRVGDLIWCRETWRVPLVYDKKKPSEITLPHVIVQYKASTINFDPYLSPGCTMGKWRPSIHMPKKFCREWLKITNVCNQRLQNITYGEVAKEGYRVLTDEQQTDASHKHDAIHITFAHGWDSIAKPGYSWNDNPLVYALTFERKEK